MCPEATRPTTVPTVTRIPRMHGRPPIFSGSAVIRVKVFTSQSIRQDGENDSELTFSDSVPDTRRDASLAIFGHLVAGSYLRGHGRRTHRDRHRANCVCGRFSSPTLRAAFGLPNVISLSCAARAHAATAGRHAGCRRLTNEPNCSRRDAAPILFGPGASAPGRSRAATAAVSCWAAARTTFRAWEQRARRMMADAECVLGRQAGVDSGSWADCGRLPTRIMIRACCRCDKPADGRVPRRTIVADALARGSAASVGAIANA